jgi:hypothetical protein
MGASPDAGKMIIYADNDMGAWVTGDARKQGNFSATVQLLTNETNVAGACAYASGYPPVGRYVSATEIVFTGTPMYIITLTPTGGGADEIVEAGGTLLLPCGYTMSSFTDATGAPGIPCLVPSALSLTAGSTTICAGETVTLTASAADAAFYSLDGTVWQASPVFERSPVTSASYTLYVKSAENCVASAANAATVTVYPVSSIPPAAPTQDGPKCAGTGITFSATKPAAATGLDWTGSVSGQGTSKTTATTAGNYSAQVRSYLISDGTTCYSEWTGATGGTITAIPPVPSAAPTQNGPKCAGTGITFSATKPAAATGLDWTGSVSGQGTVTSKTTATTAGNYSARVRSYLTSGGTTCYSGWTGSTTGTVNSLAQRDQANNGCCASGLTVCNGYCRDLAADQATCYAPFNLEITHDCWNYDHIACSTPTGWTSGAWSMAHTQAIAGALGLPYHAWSSETYGTQCRYACTGSGCYCPNTQTVERYWLKYR